MINTKNLCRAFASQFVLPVVFTLFHVTEGFIINDNNKVIEE